MGRRWIATGGVVVFLGLLARPCGGNPAGAEAKAAMASATVTGVVILRQPEARLRPPRYYRGQYRAAHVRPGVEPPPTAARSVVVYLDSVPAPPEGWPLPAHHPEMRQYHDRFEPHVLPILRGTTVSFPNQDNHYHNVFSVVAGERFDLGRYGEGDTRFQTFAQPAVVVVRCEIHTAMKAYILVRDNPLFTIPDDAGRFRLKGVPAGTWTLVAWHPVQGAQRRTVVVPPGGTAFLEVTF